MNARWLLLPLSLLSGCGHISDELDSTAASRIARPAFMVERAIPTQTYTLNSWERMHERAQTADIYIGEGGPTPYHALGLHIASRDQGDNVAWLAQPCQFLSPSAAGDCTAGGPGDEATLAAYNDALDDMRARYDLSGFNLIGYDSGAAIAAHLAAARKDVVSLRTIAGTLDLAHGIAPALRTMPQMHFIAAGDEDVPPAIYHSFRQAVGESGCVRYAMIQDADHRKGWVEAWPKLLKLVPGCGPAKAMPAAAAAPTPADATPLSPYAKEAIDRDPLDDPLPPSPYKDGYKK